MKSFLKNCIITGLGFIIGIIFLYAAHLRNRPDLQIWHLAELTAEVTSEEIKQMSGLDDYIAQESIVFKQLEKKIYDVVDESDGGKLNRYLKTGYGNPDRFRPQWNRTIELVTDTPQAAVLMLHGLSDSPYSMRSLAESLHKRNCQVTVLRLPGHGTAPSGLIDVKWQDFSAAVRLAARDLTAKTAPGIPFYIIGYSNGAALAIEYSLSQLLGEKVRQPDGLILISPAVAVSDMASMAKWNIRLAALPGLRKLAWLSIGPEFDAYKYYSFAINGGKQVYRITRRIQDQINKLDQGRGVKNFPPVLTLQSAADATTSPDAMITNFMERLAPNHHRLILFDINHMAAEMIFMKNSLQPTIEKMLHQTLPFAFDLVTNRDKEGTSLRILQKNALTKEVRTVRTDLSWPPGVYSLSHVALPFPADDPLYGIHLKSQNKINLGKLEPRGEKELLELPIAELMRIRCNPFYPYLEEQIIKEIIDQPTR